MGGKTAFASKGYLAVRTGARVVGLFGLCLRCWRSWTCVNVPCEAGDVVALASAVLADGLESVEEVESLSGLQWSCYRPSVVSVERRLKEVSEIDVVGLVVSGSCTWIRTGQLAL